MRPQRTLLCLAALGAFWAVAVAVVGATAEDAAEVVPLGEHGGDHPFVHLGDSQEPEKTAAEKDAAGGNDKDTAAGDGSDSPEPEDEKLQTTIEKGASDEAEQQAASA